MEVKKDKKVQGAVMVVGSGIAGTLILNFIPVRILKT